MNLLNLMSIMALLLWFGGEGVQGFIIPASSRSVRPSLALSAAASVSSSSSSSPPKYVRWHETPQGWAMQTAVTTFEAVDTPSYPNYLGTRQQPQRGDRIELHAQLHFGDASYFDYYNSRAFNKERTAVLYELLLDEALLKPIPLTGTTGTQQQRTVASPLSASPNDQQTALQYGWACQVDQIRYDQPSWIHADLSRQEFLALAQQQGGGEQKDRRPLWQVARQQDGGNSGPFVVPAAATEAATALLVGPPILENNSAASSERRLFSNLFLPGNALAQTLRAMLWFTVPSPELSILLLDWSSLLVNRVAGLSQVAVPLLQSLASARFDQTRRLVFGQVVVTGNQLNNNNNSNRQGYDLLIQQRNQKALQVLQETREALQDEKESAKEPSVLALLYGCSHAADLHQRLIQEYGFRPIKTEWRTAWTVSPLSSRQNGMAGAAAAAAQEQEAAARTTAIGLLVLLPIYFGIGGWDWISTVRDVAQETFGANGSASSSSTNSWELATFNATFYLARHLLLYVGLSKFLLDWEESQG